MSKTKKTGIESSTLNELAWSRNIFIIYLIWDICAESYTYSYHSIDNNTFSKKFIGTLKLTIKKIIPTLCCTILCFVCYYLFRNITISSKVVIVDFILILLFIWFRGLKAMDIGSYKLTKNEIPSDIAFYDEKGIDITNKIADKQSKETITIKDKYQNQAIRYSVYILPIIIIALCIYIL